MASSWCLFTFLLRTATWSVAFDHGALAQDVPWELKLAGVCDNNLHLQGLSFTLEGATRNGAPYWKGVTEDGNPFFIYYDEDCDGNNDGEPRWIIDRDAPSLEALVDLDGDHACDYIARVDSEDKSRPPMEASWRIQCGLGEVKEWRDQYMILLGFTSTATTTTRRGRTPPPTTTTTPEETAVDEEHQDDDDDDDSRVNDTNDSDNDTNASDNDTNDTNYSDDDDDEDEDGPARRKVPKMLVLQGACPFNDHLNGLTFVMVSSTADGAPYYKALGEQEYLYRDVDCNGHGDAHGAKWILDSYGDGQCNYQAWVLSEGDDALTPPARAVWRMYCGEDSWRDVTITLTSVDRDMPMSSLAAGGPATSLLAAAAAVLSTVALGVVEL